MEQKVTFLLLGALAPALSLNTVGVTIRLKSTQPLAFSRLVPHREDSGTRELPTDTRSPGALDERTPPNGTAVQGASGSERTPPASERTERSLSSQKLSLLTELKTCNTV